MQLPNIPEYLLSYAAICALGATLQPVHMPYLRAELSTLLGHSGAQMFICAIRPEGIEAVKHVVPLSELFAALAGSTPLELPHKRSAEERFLLLYTSGTSDKPSGVPHGQRGFLGTRRRPCPR